MKERIIRIGVLTSVFFASLYIFTSFMNHGNADMTVDMGAATLPTISFLVGDHEINLSAGHVNEMDIPSMRDTITTLEGDGTLQGKIESYDTEVFSASYEVYSLDGKEQILEEKELEDTEVFQLNDVLEDEKESVLKITLELEDEKSVHYYTRVIQSKETYLEECLNFVKELHSKMLTGTDSNGLKHYLESNSSGDNTTLQHVNIHSDLEHVTWGDLNPEIVGQVRCDVQETKEAYTSILLSYQVKCEGDNNPEEIYDVREFFRVRYSDGDYYLLTYDRQIYEVFDGTNIVLGSKGIILGLTTEDLQYKVNQEGTIVSFVQNRELWSYNKEEDEFALVFSFADSENSDVRSYFDNHSIKILSMEENGNITFGVYGYMNRGIHEGESGIAVYYFNLAQNVIEEKAFLSSMQSKLMIENHLGELAYYNNETNILYLLAESVLYKVDLNTGEHTVLLENLTEGKYVSSNDGHQIAYQKNEKGTEIEVRNFLEDSVQEISVSEEEKLHPLGFISDDFVYGVSKIDDMGKDSSGEDVEAMYKIEICNAKNEVVKTYQVDGTYILDTVIEGNMITLQRAVKRDGVYSNISQDYITNNEERVSSVSLKSYWTNLKETQYRLVFEDGIDNKKAKVLKPKHVLFEEDRTIVLDSTSSGTFFNVYGLGELAGIYTEAGAAIQKAEEVSGVVLSPGQRYVWEDGNRVAWYRNFEMRAFKAQTGESTLEASVRAVLEYEGKTVDVKTEMASKSAYKVLEENLSQEVIRFQDCSAKDMFYLIDKGTPVIAMTGNGKAIVLIGYDAVSATYIEPETGAVRIQKIEQVDEMAAAGGNTFLGYVN